MKRLLRDIAYFFILAMMVVGVTGVIFHAIGENGWIERFLGGLLNQAFTTLGAIVLGVVLIGWLTRRWLIATQANALFNDLLMYAMVALGMVFLGRITLYGTL